MLFQAVMKFLAVFQSFWLRGGNWQPNTLWGRQFPVCNTKWLKNGKLRKAILSAFYNISQRKLWNITNFVMLFQTVMKFFSRFACYWDQNLIYNANDHYEIHAAACARTYLFLFIECLEDITEKLCTHWIKLSRIMSKFTEWAHKITAQVNL
jgi:hypothetical protein